ncbi:transglycosylase domain-containing protein [Miniimonas sp. S16]|uniref:transglycosylase domain-containing protein n=1 Tax=Miniimonas sp. S16 TaxID=2171623 RepID=UPI000D527EDE|nr:transglycosylase domain-containing protein [Miniimonas sp. S16]
MPSAPRAPRHRVNVFQAIALLMAFLLLAAVGGVLSAGLLMPAVAAIGTTSNAAQQLFDDLPTDLEIQPPSEQSRVLASDGSTLATFFAENRIVVPLTEISPYMQHAVIATEDQRFYEHSGVDPEGLMRAALQTLQGNIQGASTLTQQYVKNVLIEAGVVSGDDEAIEAAREADGAEGINRKLREMKLAISLEKVYTKDEILQGYLNIAQFGASRLYGVEAASQYYFGHSAKDMTPAEAALVAGVTKSPGLYDPTRGADDGYLQATNRRDTVLGQMHAQGYITDDEYATALATPVADMLHVTPTPVGCATAGISAYFCEYVTKVVLLDGYLSDDVDEARQLLQRGGYTITTTIDPVRQQQAFDSLTAQIPENDPSYISKKGEEGISGSIVTVEPGTGNVVAMVQNTTYGDATAENPRATKVNFNVDAAYGGGQGFQTGSTFKAFILTQWLIDGHSLNETVNAANGQTFPANTWNISCSPESVATYEPKNLEPGGGQMTVLQATENSVNTAFAYMANKLDLCAVRNTTSAMGVHVGAGTIDPNDVRGTDVESLYEAQAGSDILAIPSMALGSNTIAPLTMSAAFATYAANGVFCEPRSITSITDRDGAQLEIPGSQCSQAIDPTIAAGVTYALQNVVSSGTATGAQIGRPAAGKTGTANEDYNAWFVGYTPQLSTAVWMGHSEGDIPMTRTVLNGRYYSQIYGGRIPAPIWGDYMKKAMDGLEVKGFAEAQEKQIWGDRIAVPNVIGQSIARATSILEGAGFTVTVGEQRPSDNIAVGSVGAQSSTGRMTKGSVITLYPSSGPAPVETPTTDPNAQQTAPAADTGGGNGGGGNGGGGGGGGGRGDG